jgi:hypothetical protein
MKTSHVPLLLLLCAGSLRAESVTLTLSPVLPLPAGASVKASSATITLAAGDTAEMTFAPLPDEHDYDLAPRKLIQYDTAGQTFQMQTVVTPPGWETEADSRAYGGLPKLQPFKVAGPGTIKLVSQYADTKALATFSITRANAVPAVTPANAVVIPNDAAGNFQVTLESSTDLITWTAATPGSYSGTNQQRFFRTRVEKK